MIRLS